MRERPASWGRQPSTAAGRRACHWPAEAGGPPAAAAGCSRLGASQTLWSGHGFAAHRPALPGRLPAERRLGRTVINLTHLFATLAADEVAVSAAMMDYIQPAVLRDRVRQAGAGGARARVCGGTPRCSSADPSRPCHGARVPCFKASPAQIGVSRLLTARHCGCCPCVGAADVPPPAGRTSFAALMAAHVRQRFPQLSRLDRHCTDLDTWKYLFRWAGSTAPDAKPSQAVARPCRGGPGSCPCRKAAW